MFLTNDNLRRVRKEPQVLGLRYRVRNILIFLLNFYIAFKLHQSRCKNNVPFIAFQKYEINYCTSKF